MERLHQSLALLGCTSAVPLHVRSNLLSAIMLFAVACEDAELEQACADELRIIKTAATL